MILSDWSWISKRQFFPFSFALLDIICLEQAVIA
jgi:hypothetical protein